MLIRPVKKLDEHRLPVGDGRPSTGIRNAERKREREEETDRKHLVLRGEIRMERQQTHLYSLLDVRASKEVSRFSWHDNFRRAAQGKTKLPRPTLARSSSVTRLLDSSIASGREIVHSSRIVRRPVRLHCRGNQADKSD